MTELGNTPIKLSDIYAIVYSHMTTEISAASMRKIEEIYRAMLVHASGEQPIYGINTGFGALAEVRISHDDQATMQTNIILSHAVGVGEPLDFLMAKTIILLRLNTLAQGYSGASPKLVKHLLRLLNSNCAPVIPRKGSVGASGDLAPLAHVGLLLLGIGDGLIDKQQVSAKAALDHAHIPPLRLGLRDGLALINGTQAMAAVAAIALKECQELAMFADVVAATSLDALGGFSAPFDERLHRIKPHPGQIKTAKNIQNIIRGRTQNIKNLLTQDPYSLRCIPQVHGATKDVIEHVRTVVEIEINSVTDNPLIFLESQSGHLDILSGGNFHGQHLALALDYLAMGMAELANIAERRLELLLNPKHSNGLPAFLIDNCGINSGYMMMHVTASALVNENKILTHPASTDSIPTSANREDHVSMGMTSANKLMQVIENTKHVLAIECLASNQALDLRPHNPAGHGVKKIHRAFRQYVHFRSQDGLYKDDLTNALLWLNANETKILINEILNNE